jgi:hypothetical protein
MKTRWCRSPADERAADGLRSEREALAAELIAVVVRRWRLVDVASTASRFRPGTRRDG